MNRKRISSRATAERRGSAASETTTADETAEHARGIGGAELAQRAFALLAENARHYAIVLLDPNGVITLWGEGARRLLQWTSEQADGAHLRLLYPDGGSDDGTAETHLEVAARTGEYTGEGYRVRGDGSTFWAGSTLTSLRDAADTVLGHVLVTRDLTAPRALEAAQKAAQETAEEANLTKSTLLAAVSHEIRTPLTSIVAYTDLLKMGAAGALGPKQQEYLDRMKASSQHLLGMVDDLLDISRAEAGRLHVGREKLRAATVVSQTLAVADPQAKKRQVEVIDAVSAVAADECCWGDPERIRQALLNLIVNAIKFTEPGGQVVVSAGQATEAPAEAEVERGTGPWVYFRVEDTGRGIGPEHLEHIFEPFVQVQMEVASSRRHGGTGLGLAISRQLARRMGGDVTVRSEPGIGSSFFLWLPAAVPDDTAPVAVPVLIPPAGILQEIRAAVLADLEGILDRYGTRLRADPDTARARVLSETELEDHLASFLADIAQTLGSMPLAQAADSDLLRDGTAIQRTIAERHGRQRARLGWSESEVRREYAILADEMTAAVRRRLRPPREAQVEEVIGVLQEFLDRAETISLTSYRVELGI